MLFSHFNIELIIILFFTILLSNKYCVIYVLVNICKVSEFEPWTQIKKVLDITFKVLPLGSYR